MEGKILAAKYARENRIPYLGICLGMQIAVIEYARSVLGLQNANSREFDPNTKNPCVIFMPEVKFRYFYFIMDSPYDFSCVLGLILVAAILICRSFSQGSKTHMGGTMRLGSRRTYFHVKDSKSAKL